MSDSKILDRLRTLEQKEAVAEEKIKNLEDKVKGLSGGIARGLWILGGGFISAFVAWIVGGGLAR